METADRTVDHRLSAAQQNFEAILFDWGVKTADDANFTIAQGLCRIIGFEDEVAGALDGAKEGDRIL